MIRLLCVMACLAMLAGCARHWVDGRHWPASGHGDAWETWCAEALLPPVKRAVPTAGYALSLSGGGYRAMLYHVGALQRLNDAGVLAELEVVSSVSGGSIAAGILARSWKQLRFVSRSLPPAIPEAPAVRIAVAENFHEVIAKPASELASRSIALPAVISGLLPFISSADRLSHEYDRRLFNGMLLRDLREVEERDGTEREPRSPVFIFNATSLQTGELWQFRSRAMGGPLLGWTDPGDLRLAQAVAASSAFPPFLSPLYMSGQSTEKPAWAQCAVEVVYQGTNLRQHTRRVIEAHETEFRKRVYLVDGGVRDNLALLAVDHINRLRVNEGRRALDQLVSDGGTSFASDLSPYSNWFAQAYRVLDLALTEPDLLRIDALIDRSVTIEDETERKSMCKEAERWVQWRRRLCLKPDAAYWSIQRRLPDHWTADPDMNNVVSADTIRTLGGIPTRLSALPELEQRKLVNWGYVSAHFGLPFINRLGRMEVVRLNECHLPYPAVGVIGESEPRLCVRFKPEIRE